MTYVMSDIHGQYEKYLAMLDKIYIDHGHIAVDCGAGFDMPLGCIRLDDFQTFYV